MDGFTHNMVQTVLVVEDDPLLRMDAVDIIEDAGFRVLEAADADRALALLRRNGRIDALFTDIDMPGRMNGLELSRLVHATMPGMRIVVTSGQWSIEEDVLPDGGCFLSKPYRPDDLVAALNRHATALSALSSK